MENHTSKAQQAGLIIATLLIALFFYTASSKLLDMEEFKRQLANQTLPKWSVHPLLWIIPTSEILVSALLISKSTRRIGFYFSAILMLIFTTYMGLVLLNVFDRVPCSCGGVIKYMQFSTHFLFNLFFLALSAIGLYISKNQRKGGLRTSNEISN